MRLNKTISLVALFFAVSTSIPTHLLAQTRANNPRTVAVPKNISILKDDNFSRDGSMNEATATETVSKEKATTSTRVAPKLAAPETNKKSDGNISIKESIGNALESFMPLQFKYAIMMNESVEKLTNIILYKNIDSWYGTRYRYGGKSSSGIDCSAFMQVLSEYSYGWTLPRTAREQYASMESIKREELQEGDFVFFNTTGGISHVGMYLQNNKFIHSSSSQGVVIGDLKSSYWSKRFIGARRVAEARNITPGADLQSIVDRLK